MLFLSHGHEALRLISLKNAHLTYKIVKLEAQYAVNIESIPRMDWFDLDVRNDAAQIFSE